MSTWLFALSAGIVVAFIQYGWVGMRGGWAAVTAAILRVAAIALVVALLLDAPASPRRSAARWAALDASLSMVRGDNLLWRAARDSMRRIAAESTFVFGDSVRRADSTRAPHDQTSLLRPLVERALGASHPVTVVTDGELDDPEAARALPVGSRIIVLARTPRRDLAAASIDAPRAAVSGDTIEARVAVIAGSGGGRAGSLRLSLDGRIVATQPIDSLPPFGQRTFSVKTQLVGSPGPDVLRAIVVSPDDAEPHNDTLAVAIDLSRAATAVFVSTSPDFDARYSLAVLRSALAIPTRGFLRVAPGEWRLDGALTPVSELEVRQAVREAPVAIIHGDTAVFGPPRGITLGPLALIVTSPTDGEWYASASPPSPLAPALAGILWDSLPPVGLAPTAPTGDWSGMEARRGRGEERRPIFVGTDEPRRVVIVAASGLWRWRFRGGAASDAFTAVWGSIFDWLAAARADRRAAIPDERVLRAGEPIRWRRGSAADSVVAVTVHQRGNGRVDTLTLRFGAAENIVETRSLPAGIYDVEARGGSEVLAVNPEREWLPRPPRVAAADLRGAVSADAGLRLRSVGWAYVLATLCLCAEWVIRRRRGMR
jgi:hypothetical protein